MTTNTKILIRILVIGIILIGGWWIWNPQIYAGAQEVTITTNKVEYEQGEVIKVTVKNELDKSIWYVDFPQRDLHFWGIERFKDNKWEDLAYTEGDNFRLPIEEDGKEVCYIFMYERPIGHAVELKPNAEFSFQWNQKICPYKMESKEQPFEPVFIEKGHYRFIFRYGLNTMELTKPELWEREVDLADINTIFSNEFVIK